MSTRRGWMAALAVIVLVGSAGWAIAQDAPAEEKKESKSLFTIYVLEGGNFNFLIIALSIVTVALIIENFMTLQRDKMVPPDIIVELEQLLDEEQYEEALSLCESQRNYLTNTLGAALTRAADGQEAMVSAMESACSEEDMKMAHKISWLSLCGNMGPMMGLYGTVMGMVDAFTVIATSSSQPTPAEMAGGIYTALVTTVWGLMVAMPALAAYFLLKNKIQKLSFELASVSAELVDRCKPGGAAKAGK